ERAHAADALAAIVIERDRLFAALDELLVEDVEHLEERSVGRNVPDLVGDERARALGVLLAPDVEGQVQAHLSSQDAFALGSASRSRTRSSRSLVALICSSASRASRFRTRAARYDAWGSLRAPTPPRGRSFRRRAWP